MPINVNNGSWQTAKIIHVKDGGVWRPMRRVWQKRNNIWILVYGTLDTSVSFTAGTTTWTVPEGVFSINIVGSGGGGGGGGGDGGKNNNGTGRGGGAANFLSDGPYDVTPGQVLSIDVGLGGAGSLGNGLDGQPTIVTGDTVSFSADGAQGGGGYYQGRCCGLGVYGGGNGGLPAAGLTTNGGSNGGLGGPYSSKYQGFGKPGQNGKVTISW